MHMLRIDRGALAAQSDRSHRFGRFGIANMATAIAEVAMRIVLRIVAAIAHEFRIRRDMRQLRAMSDHMLKDIGLRRADIAKIVRYGRD